MSNVRQRRPGGKACSPTIGALDLYELLNAQLAALQFGECEVPALFLLDARTRVKADCPTDDVGPGQPFVSCQQIDRVHEALVRAQLDPLGPSALADSPKRFIRGLGKRLVDGIFDLRLDEGCATGAVKLVWH